MSRKGGRRPVEKKEDTGTRERVCKYQTQLLLKMGPDTAGLETGGGSIQNKKTWKSVGTVRSVYTRINESRTQTARGEGPKVG